jgi:hypothetical protein
MISRLPSWYGERAFGRVQRGATLGLLALTLACGQDDDGSEHPASHEGVPEHCIDGYDPDPRDKTMRGEPQVIELAEGRRDVLLPAEVIAWMEEHGWQQQHNDWHNVRRMDIACRRAGAADETCAAAQSLSARGLSRAPIQEGQRGDGFAFVVMHRHMLRVLREVFPRHRALFDGFDHIPRDQADPQNPMPWREVKWSADQLRAIDRLEHIEDHIDEFATEDDLASYIQHPYHWSPDNPMVVNADASSGFHDALHGQWSITGSPALLGTNTRNIDNLVFWRLHGWIDDVWERYRKAAGIEESEPGYQAELLAQCKEMHDLGVGATQPGPIDPPPMTMPTSSFFDQQVRPALAAKCSGCHEKAAPNAGLVLEDSSVSATEFVARLASVKSTNGEYALVVPGEPQQSWLYLKASGESAQASCGATCNRQAMPPAGEKLSSAELAALAQWIRDGAKP